MPTRDLWHWSFAHLVKQRAPPTSEVRPEVLLSDHPQRADLLLLRRRDVPPRDGEAQVMRGLWAHLGVDTVVEFKSPVKGFRKRDLMRLASYGAQYHVLEAERLGDPRDLTLALVIPSRNAAFDDEVARMRWTYRPLGGGYGRIDGGVYTVYLVETDEVALAEADDFLRIFSHHDGESAEALWWWERWTAEDKTVQDVKELEGYEEMVKKFVGRLTTEQRLAGLAPEQRLAGLAPEQQLLALPDDVL